MLIALLQVGVHWVGVGSRSFGGIKQRVRRLMLLRVMWVVMEGVV